MSDRAPDWTVPVMRTGYAARAVTYAIIGGLAVWAAWTGGAAEGSSGALATLRGAWWGIAALWLVAIGLAAYALWRVVDAALDLDAQGSDAKGMMARTGQVVTGFIHAALGLTAARLAIGSGGGSGGGGSAETAVSKLMQLPYGPTIVILAGIVTIGAGGYYIRKAVKQKYKNRMKSTPTTEKLDPLLRLGLIANGIVVGLIGAFIVFAGMQADPGEAGGIGQAFETVRGAPFGRILLVALGGGMMLFGLHCAVQAVYRVIPRHSGKDVQTMAGDLTDHVRAKVG